MQREKKFFFLKLPGKRIRSKQYKCGQQMLQANHDTSEWLYSGDVQYKSKPRVLYHNYRIIYLFAQLRNACIPCLGFTEICSGSVDGLWATTPALGSERRGLWSSSAFVAASRSQLEVQCYVWTWECQRFLSGFPFPRCAPLPAKRRTVLPKRCSFILKTGSFQSTFVVFCLQKRSLNERGAA